MAATLCAIGLFSLVAGGVGSLINTITPFALLSSVGIAMAGVSASLLFFHKRLMRMELSGIEDESQKAVPAEAKLAEG
jgi:hypothetical protein